MSVLDRGAIIAPKTFNRWLVPPAALAIHLCIGEVYAFSVFKNPIAEKVGLGASGAVATGWIFSIAILMLGVSSAVLGTWVEKVGPRKSMAASGLFWVVGFLVSAFGVSIGQLWIVYLGYGFIGGIGLGIGYISPVSTLMKWFPDKPGLSTGLAIMGFGGGALIASPLSNAMMSSFGNGKLANGVAGTFIALAVIYIVVIALGAYVIRLPHPDWTPNGFDPALAKAKPMQSSGNVSAKQAIRTPQFWLLWVVLFTNVTAGIGILESASPMIQSSFGVAAVAAGGFVGLLSIFNMGGRFVWSSVSDYIGRKNTYFLYLGVGLLLYLALASFGSSSLWLFVICALLILSFYGGGFATMPAYLKDLFGVYQVGAIHGRVLTAWSAAGVAGPLIVNSIVQAEKGAGLKGFELYRLSLFIMVGVLAVGFIANLLIKKMSPKYFEDPEVVGAKSTADRTAADEALALNKKPAQAGSTSPVYVTLAAVLAIIVVAGLTYGVIQTALTGVKLFA